MTERYGPWDRVYDLFRHWQRDGTWARTVTRLQAEADAKGLITWDVNADSTVCRAHQHAAGARRKRAADPGRATPGGLKAEPDDHALGRSRGGLTTKIRLAVDASSHVLVAAGQRADAPVFTEVMGRTAWCAGLGPWSRVLRVRRGRPWS